MKFFAATAALVGAASAMQYSNVTYTTEVVTAYTTYCPAATQITTNGKTYTVSEATTLTITDCPCTVTKPVIPSTPVPTTTAAPTAPKPITAPAGPMNYTTTVMTTDYFTTYCPSATTVVQNNKTYTVTSATTLTISDCPCTLTKSVPVTTTTYTTDYYTTYCPSATTVVQNSKTYTVTKPTTLTISDCPCTMTSVVPVMPVSQSTSKPSVTGFVPVSNGTSSNLTASATGYKPAQQTTNAGARLAGAGAGAIAGLAGLVFFL